MEQLETNRATNSSKGSNKKRMLEEKAKTDDDDPKQKNTTEVEIDQTRLQIFSKWGGGKIQIK